MTKSHGEPVLRVSTTVFQSLDSGYLPVASSVFNRSGITSIVPR